MGMSQGSVLVRSEPGEGKTSPTQGAAATLRLGQQDMLIDGRRVRLSPGMNITAEIKTGQRRVIEYLLSPIQRAASEALRER